MAKSCIICGNATGTREHIFPAALGGRRTNKGIYCPDHNNAYAPLAGVITNQISTLNALLGVVGDHSTTPTTTKATEVDSGREMQLSIDKIQFSGPRIISREPAEAGVNVEMAFNNQQEIDDWEADQKSKGFDVKFVSKGKRDRYHIASVKNQLQLGGADGLRAIGYVAQTFLAHFFPDIARRPELFSFKEYTLNGIGSDMVWWDFNPPSEMLKNIFPFGHRIVVGMDAASGVAYARVIIFSMLSFAVRFASVSIDATASTITDIDPLAKSPPNDIVSWSISAAFAMVENVADVRASLREAVETGAAQAAVSDLIRRIEDFQRECTAQKIMDKLGDLKSLSLEERKNLFASIVRSETQRVFNLMRYVANDVARRATNPIEIAMAKFLEKAAEADPTSRNGFSPNADRFLAISCEALERQMEADFQENILTLDRIGMIFGGGIGAGCVGEAILAKFIETFDGMI